VGLVELLHEQPLEQGLAELVGYLSLRDTQFRVVFDEEVAEQVAWSDRSGESRVASLPRVTFVRFLEPDGPVQQ
jgi:hypothetical protein